MVTYKLDDFCLTCENSDIDAVGPIQRQKYFSCGCEKGLDMDKAQKEQDCKEYSERIDDFNY